MFPTDVVTIQLKQQKKNACWRTELDMIRRDTDAFNAVKVS